MSLKSVSLWHYQVLLWPCMSKTRSTYVTCDEQSQYSTDSIFPFVPCAQKNMRKTSNCSSGTQYSN
jgi:hypothetical protein